jgi:hypothetical protein
MSLNDLSFKEEILTLSPGLSKGLGLVPGAIEHTCRVIESREAASLSTTWKMLPAGAATLTPGCVILFNCI